MRIFCSGFPYSTTQEEIFSWFNSYGRVLSADVKIKHDPKTRKTFAFAFVEMPDAEEAKSAIGGLNGYELGYGGKKLKVEEATPIPNCDPAVHASGDECHGEHGQARPRHHRRSRGSRG